MYDTLLVLLLLILFWFVFWFVFPSRFDDSSLLCGGAVGRLP